MTPLCSTASLNRDEPMAGTASRVERWLLVEHRGAWGPPALPLARMDPQLAAHLVAAAAAQGARLLLLRRPKGVQCPPGRVAYLVDSRPGREQVLTRHLADDAALLDLPLGARQAAGWRPCEDPLLLVCTHGRHDRCCAIKGRPVAAALSALRPAAVWECSHTGGDRFAANVLVMPYGLYLGRVGAADGGRLLADLDAGRVPAAWMRGRSSLSLPAQAAQEVARAQYGRRGLADLLPVEQRGTGPDNWSVRLAGPGGDLPDVEVEVRYDRHGDGERHVLTCDAVEPKLAPVFRPVAVRVLT